MSLRKAERLAGVLQALGHQFPVDRPDDADLYESSLRNFYEGMWPVIEPKTPFRGNWHLDAICEHLEYAVVRRQILQLLINMPPRFSKSTLCSVALPAYIWAMFPHIRWLYASYAQSLSTRDSVLCRRVIQSPWYQARWGHVFRLTTDQNIKQRYENDRTGARIATSVGAALTGEGGDVLVCFPREALVLTERGPVPIGDIVEQRQRVRVWSVDGDGRQVLRRVVGWKKNPGADMVRVDFGNGHAVCCTGDHRLMTSSGWVEALSLAPGDVLPCFSVPDVQYGRLIDTKLPGKRPRRLVGVKDIANILLRELGPGVGSAAPRVPSGAALGEVPTSCPTVSDRGYVTARDAELGCELFRSCVAIHDALNFGIRELGVRRRASGLDAPGADCVGDVVGAGAVGKILSSVVQAVSVEVARVASTRAWADEGFRDKSVDMAVKRLVPLAEAYAAIPAQWGRLEYAGVDGHAGPGPSFDNTGDAADIPIAGHHVKPLKADDVSPLGVCWCGHRESSYCLTVEHDHNFMVNIGGVKYIIAANCDDAHNVVEAESDAARKGAVDWFNSSMSTRLNDAKTGVKIVVMQRVHQDDLAGHLLETGDWYHLCLPMEFEGVKPQWVIGWTDPREKEGELLWPERYGPDEVARLKRALGSYGAAAQLQQRPTPRGGGIFKGAWFGSYKAAPEFVRIVESWDTATSEKEHAAYSVGTAWGETVNGDILLLDVSRGRWDFPRLKAEVAFFHAKHRGSVILVEDKSSGRQVCQELGRDVRLPILPVSVGKSDKVARAITVSPMVEAGKVKLPEDAPWLADYMEEVLLFPNSRNADQVDSTTQALAYMRNGGVTARMDLS